MKCPYCAQEMRYGYIHNQTQPVQWIPDGVKPSVWRGGLAKRAVQLGEDSFWFDSKAQAFYCAACKIIIIPAE